MKHFDNTTHNIPATAATRALNRSISDMIAGGEVSAGVNFFNPGAQTAVFAKADYVFADETQGVSVKGGMRYNW